MVRNEHDLKEQIHRFFEEWKWREGTGASVQKLIDAVRAAGLPQDILDALHLALPGIYTSSLTTMFNALCDAPCIAIEFGGGSMMPVQETARDAATRRTPARDNSERDLVRMKRLQKLSISDPNNPSCFPPQSSPPSSRPRWSASTPSDSPTVSDSERKNSEPTAIEFELGQVVKVDHKPKPWYGVIKYIGPIHNCPGIFAGLDLVCTIIIAKSLPIIERFTKTAKISLSIIW